METTFSSLLEHIETFPVNAEVNKKEEELYCATAFITLLQSGLLTQDVDESGDGLTKKQDVLDFKDFESQSAIKCLAKIMQYDLPEGVRDKLLYLKPKVEELSRLNHYIAINNRQMQETLLTALKRNNSNSGCMVTMLILVGIALLNLL